MRHSVKRLKSLHIALKELEPFIKDGDHIKSGAPLKSMGGMRSREAIANWVMCAAASRVTGASFSFTSDPTGGDGLIECGGHAVPTEHVYVPRHASGDESIEDRIVSSIIKKMEKGGEAYAKGKVLIVFLDDGRGEWFPRRVLRRIPKPMLFEAIWLVYLRDCSEGAYTYHAVHFGQDAGVCSVATVSIAPEFGNWSVETQII